MYLVVGLGNPGPKFKNTPHNVGFRVVERLAGKEKWHQEKEDYLFLKKEIRGRSVQLVKPLTFMNRSGQAVKKIKNKNGPELRKTIVVHDDCDLPLGRIKIGRGQGSAGHKGVQSVIDKLGTKDFFRVRVGVGLPSLQKIDRKSFVLRKMEGKEKRRLKKGEEKAVKALRLFLEQGPGPAMTFFNQK